MKQFSFRRLACARGMAIMKAKRRNGFYLMQHVHDGGLDDGVSCMIGIITTLWSKLLRNKLCNAELIRWRSGYPREEWINEIVNLILNELFNVGFGF